ncbi:NfeD family protein [Magnetofaba australis]|uniref:Putative activity regulator of membrane protease YbbK-like protein n=1 Tax=Magnetofaba australis IT-1 TaxID=1434232 RepID=A0A1Y2K7H0_9PROT|nr:NfeD family protein [Magnetofaba australis]OSM06244.1 putative activity regulator of membrane protease YbbK-like protein [Magnetofaba australis IT-1]
MELEWSVISHWHWWIAGALFLIIELLSPAFFFLWLGVAAGVTGAALLLFPELDWKWQTLLFAGLSLAALYIWHRVIKHHPQESDAPQLNQRGAQYVGRQFTLIEPIVNGMGRIRVDDASWRIHGADLPAGAVVTVVAVEGVTLRVEAASTQSERES